MSWGRVQDCGGTPGNCCAVMGGTDPQLVLADVHSLASVSRLAFAIVVASKWRYSEHLALACTHWSFIFQAQSMCLPADVGVEWAACLHWRQQMRAPECGSRRGGKAGIHEAMTVDVIARVHASNILQSKKR